MKALTTLALTGSLLALPTAARAADLELGDKAPHLSAVNWLKGDPVPEFGRGDKVYVLDFWATWCGPCIRSIPHINELQQELREDVTVIGVAIWPRDNMTPTAEYVEQRGDEMDYTIAEDIDGAMATAFMKASGNTGIPTAMIVDRDGTLAWMGHPMAGMDEILHRVVAGDFDAEAYAAAQAAEAAAQKRAAPLMEELQVLMGAGEHAEAAELALEIADLHPSLEGYRLYAVQGFMLAGASPRAVAAGQEVLDGSEGEASHLLNSLAWMLVAPSREGEVPRKELDLALVAATRASELTDNADASVLDTLARVHWRRGNGSMAALLQQSAIDHADGDDEREAYARILAEYQG